MNPLPQIVSTSALAGPQLTTADQPDITDPRSRNISTYLDENDNDRSRTLRACQACRRSKLKCDGRTPACERCIKYRRECIFRPLEKREKRRKGTEYIESLERRLVEMEELLRSSGLPEYVTNGQTREARPGYLHERSRAGNRESELVGLQTNSRSTSPKQNTMGDFPVPNQPTTMASREPHQEVESKWGEGSAKDSIEILSDKMGTLMTNYYGEAKYIGLSSGFSVLPSNSIEGIGEKTGDTSVQTIMASIIKDDKFHDFELHVFSDLFQRRTYEQLPAKKECLGLLEVFFKDFNNVFPLFHPPTFMYLVERQYSSDPYRGSGWWACLNVVLAISHRLRVRYSKSPEEEEIKAWGYLKNSMGMLAELMIQNTDLSSVQALLGIALFMYCTSNPQPSFSLVAASIRLSHSIGLHKRGSAFNFNTVEIEQRNRVFWIAYILDKDICLRTGRPPAQDDNDMNVELPSSVPEDSVGIIVVAGTKVNLFRLMSQFATIQSKIFTRLYSADAAKQCAVQLLKSAERLDNELEEWRMGIPIGFRPDHDLGASYAHVTLRLVLLHLAYYNSLATIHRMSEFCARQLSESSIQDLKSHPPYQRFFAAHSLVVAAARSTINLLAYIPREDSAWMWPFLYYPLTSLINLFSNILRNPQDKKAREDLNLMESVVEFLSTLKAVKEDRSVEQMLDFCFKLKRIATAVCERSDKRTSPRERPKKNIAGHAVPVSLTIPDINMMLSPMDQQSSAMPFSPQTSNHIHAGFDYIDPNLLSGSIEEEVGIPQCLNGEISPDYMTEPEKSCTSLFGDMQKMNNGIGIDDLQPSVNFDSLQQSLLTRNMWLMPMKLDWDWEGLIDSSYPSVDFDQSN